MIGGPHVEHVNKDKLPVLPLRDEVIYPNGVKHLDVGRAESVKAIDWAMLEDRRILLIPQKDSTIKEVDDQDLYTIGTVSHIKQLLKLPNGALRILVEGKERVNVSNFDLRPKGPLFATFELRESNKDMTTTERLAYVRLIEQQFKKYVQISSKLSIETYEGILEIGELSALVDIVATHVAIKFDDKFALLEIDSLAKRAEYLIQLLKTEQELLKVEKHITRNVKGRIEKTQKDYYLREQLKEIKAQLGEGAEGLDEIEEYRSKIDASDMTETVKEIAKKELLRLERTASSSQEANVIRNYLDWLIRLPWQNKSKDRLDVKAAKKVLDEDHYGLVKVKDRILEYLAVKQLTEGLNGAILCLVGPPGVGKTSLAKSIARAMNRQFVRISLGGVNDESEIRGHRRTYVGAMPGRIIQAMDKAETINPVVLLDEIDKLVSDPRRDPTSAMLEVLDPEQNITFSDHYINEPYDLSQVLFVATANTRETIPSALLDRMEIIHLSGYTELEKFSIATNYLVPKQLAKHGLKKDNLQLRKDALMKVIREYTREAGVRRLEQQIAAISRKAARMYLESDKKRIIVTEKRVFDFLGHPIYRYGAKETEDTIGTATGLAYTAFGGDILSIEVNVVPGTGKLQLTGKLGDVMKESAQAAVSYIRSRQAVLGIEEDFHKNVDLHIHVPEGAVPKDGPSAGITMVTALVSALTEQPIKKEVAMTGEVTLRGHVLPIGGLKEKAMSAHRSGITTIIMPKENEKDIDDIPESVRNSLSFIPVTHMDEVLTQALVEVKK